MQCILAPGSTEYCCSTAIARGWSATPSRVTKGRESSENPSARVGVVVANRASHSLLHSMQPMPCQFWGLVGVVSMERMEWEESYGVTGLGGGPAGVLLFIIMERCQT
jgi:hypothetical protein